MTEDRPKLNWLRIKSEADLTRIMPWLKGRRVNTRSMPKTDKNGDWIMLFGWDDKPDSDWGKFRGNSAAIWFASKALADTAEKLLEGGWK